MNGGAAPRWLCVAADGKGTRDRFDAVAAAEPGDEGMSEGSILEIEGKGIVGDTRRPGRRGRPPFGAASLVEPGMHDLDLATQPFRRHRNPHTHRIPPLRLALGPYRRSDHASSPLVHVSFARIILFKQGLSRDTGRFSLAARLCAANIEDKAFGRGR
jgi:hypothetical protein